MLGWGWNLKNVRRDLNMGKKPGSMPLRISQDVEIGLVLEGGKILGIGAVEIGGIPMRSAAVPIRPDFSTPDALHYQDFILERIVKEGGRTVLKTRAVGRQEVFGEIMDEYSYNLAFPTLRKGAEDLLDWIIEPQELELDGQRYAGFSLGYKFSGGKNKIHRLVTVSTWEIGGRAEGNSIYHQAYSCQPVFRCTRKNHFSTSCLKRLDLWNSWMGNSYQMLPRWGCIQPFDFQASDKGVFLGYWKDRHSVKSLVQKNPGEDVIFVLDEYDFPITGSIITPRKNFLFSANPDPKTPRPRHEVIDMWTRACDMTAEIIRGYFGIKHCQPLPTGGPVYAGRNSIPREELKGGRKKDWLWSYDSKKGEFYFHLDGEKIPRRDFLYWVADKKLPQLHKRGVRRVMFEPIHESDFTEDAFAFHAETGWHGDLTVCSICGSRRYVPAQCYDGWRGWNYLASKARKLGMSLGHWVGLHLTPRAPILREHPEYIIQHVNTLAHSGGYSHLSICSINWCSGAKKWFLDDMKRWHDEGDLEWIFFDSWPNLGCTAINYCGKMEPMQWEMGKVLAELQKIGYNWFSFEGTSPFGVHQYGLWDPLTAYKKHVSGGILGQNDFATWIGHEYMGYNQMLGPNINKERNKSTIPEMSFRYMANRSLTLVMPDLSGHNPIPEENQWTYARIQPIMQKRFILPDDSGVRWESKDGRQALFAYKTLTLPLRKGAKVLEIRGRSEREIMTEGNVLRAKPWQAYVIC